MGLTSGQSEILDFALQGHNIVITGQAGTGKTTLVEEIIRELTDRGKNVSVICSSGIACTVYRPGVASTVHSRYGLQVADLPWKNLIERAISNEKVKNLVQKCDVVIWDEASMSSQRMLELVNAIHHCVASDIEEWMPFGGKQMILVGEFLQLRPIPNCYDDGMFMFHSSVFQRAFPHRFELTQVVRQVDIEFLHALQDVRKGKCSPESVTYLKSLSRSIGSLENSAMHIFFKKLPAALHNREQLQKIDGIQVSFTAEKDGDTSGISWPGSMLLNLKPGCRVMLVWNLNDKLRNGSLGIFNEVKEDKLKVVFEGVGPVLIKRQTWFKRDRHGNNLGNVCQFPLVLAYAVTCHKSQGLTLPSAIVHCSREFVPGLIYVAISRVRAPEQLQLLQFQPWQLNPPSQRVLEETCTHIGEVRHDLTCCGNMILLGDEDDSFFHVTDRFSDVEKESDDTFTYPIEFYEGPARSNYQQADDPIVTDIIEVYHVINIPESNFSVPPPSLDVKQLLTEQTSDNSLDQDEFAVSMNDCLRELCSSQEQLERVNVFVKILWYHLYCFLEDHIIENPDDVIVNVSKESFTSATAKVHQFINSDTFYIYQKRLFQLDDGVTPPHMAITSELMLRLYEKFICHLAEAVARFHQEEEDMPININVEEMSDPGKAKVRHVGGWAIRRVLENFRRYVHDNIDTNVRTTLSRVIENQGKCHLLEESVLIPYNQLQTTTNFPSTLELTEARQFRERGLVHISDQCFKVFMYMEQLRVNLINVNKLYKLKGNLVSEAYNVITADENLNHLWLDCFSNEDVYEKQETIRNMLIKVIFRYLNMGGCQFIRDFRLTQKIKRTAELRKKVLQKSQKREQRSDSVPFKDILKDSSHGKTETNGRLMNFIRKHNSSGLVQVYSKCELVKLCKSYGVAITTRLKKLALAEKLKPVVLANRGMMLPGLLDIAQTHT